MSDIIATREEGILILEMNAGSNTFTHGLLETLEMWLNIARSDKKLFAVILTSKSKLFSAGGDLGEMMQDLKAGDPAGYVKRIVPLVNRIIMNLVTHPLPIIAVLNGSVAGGAISMVLASDHRVAVNRAKFAFAFGSLSLTPDSGTSVLVPHYLGENFAFSNFVNGKTVSVTDLPSNLFDSICETTEEAMQKALEIANIYRTSDRWILDKTKNLVKRHLIEKLRRQLDDELNSIIEACERPNFEIKLSQTLEKMKSK